MPTHCDFSFLSLYPANTDYIPSNTVIDLDGVDDKILLPGGDGSIYDMEASDFTIEMWIKSPGTSAHILWLARGGGAGVNNRYILNREADGTLTGFVSFNSAETDRVSISTTTTIDDGDWHHIAWVRRDSSRIEIYIDGVLSASGSASISGANLSVHDVPAIGSGYFPTRFDPFYNFMQGQIDELRVWHVARTVEEINADKGRTLNGDETDLVAYFDFEQGSAGGNNTTISRLTDRVSGANA